MWNSLRGAVAGQMQPVVMLQPGVRYEPLHESLVDGCHVWKRVIAAGSDPEK